jgi:hypothetical protein
MIARLPWIVREWARLVQKQARTYPRNTPTLRASSRDWRLAGQLDAQMVVEASQGASSLSRRSGSALPKMIGDGTETAMDKQWTAMDKLGMSIELLKSGVDGPIVIFILPMLANLVRQALPGAEPTCDPHEAHRVDRGPVRVRRSRVPRPGAGCIY